MQTNSDAAVAADHRDARAHKSTYARPKSSMHHAHESPPSVRQHPDNSTSTTASSSSLSSPPTCNALDASSSPSRPNFARRRNSSGGADTSCTTVDDAHDGDDDDGDDAVIARTKRRLLAEARGGQEVSARPPVRTVGSSSSTLSSAPLESSCSDAPSEPSSSSPGGANRTKWKPLVSSEPNDDAQESGPPRAKKVVKPPRARGGLAARMKARAGRIAVAEVSQSEDDQLGDDDDDAEEEEEDDDEVQSVGDDDLARKGGLLGRSPHRASSVNREGDAADELAKVARGIHPSANRAGRLQGMAQRIKAQQASRETATPAPYESDDGRGATSHGRRGEASESDSDDIMDAAAGLEESIYAGFGAADARQRQQKGKAKLAMTQEDLQLLHGKSKATSPNMPAPGVGKRAKSLSSKKRASPTKRRQQSKLKPLKRAEREQMERTQAAIEREQQVKHARLAGVARETMGLPELLRTIEFNEIGRLPPPRRGEPASTDSIEVSDPIEALEANDDPPPASSRHGLLESRPKRRDEAAFAGLRAEARRPGVSELRASRPADDDEAREEDDDDLPEAGRAVDQAFERKAQQEGREKLRLRKLAAVEAQKRHQGGAQSSSSATAAGARRSWSTAAQTLRQSAAATAAAATLDGDDDDAELEIVRPENAGSTKLKSDTPKHLAPAKGRRSTWALQLGMRGAGRLAGGEQPQLDLLLEKVKRQNAKLHDAHRSAPQGNKQEARQTRRGNGHGDDDVGPQTQDGDDEAARTVALLERLRAKATTRASNEEGAASEARNDAEADGDDDDDDEDYVDAAGSEGEDVVVDPLTLGSGSEGEGEAVESADEGGGGEGESEIEVDSDKENSQPAHRGGGGSTASRQGSVPLGQGRPQTPGGATEVDSEEVDEPEGLPRPRRRRAAGVALQDDEEEAERTESRSKVPAARTPLTALHEATQSSETKQQAEPAARRDADGGGGPPGWSQFFQATMASPKGTTEGEARAATGASGSESVLGAFFEPTQLPGVSEGGSRAAAAAVGAPSQASVLGAFFEPTQIPGAREGGSKAAAAAVDPPSQHSVLGAFFEPTQLSAGESGPTAAVGTLSRQGTVEATERPKLLRGSDGGVVGLTQLFEDVTQPNQPAATKSSSVTTTTSMPPPSALAPSVIGRAVGKGGDGFAKVDAFEAMRRAQQEEAAQAPLATMLPSLSYDAEADMGSQDDYENWTTAADGGDSSRRGIVTPARPPPQYINREGYFTQTRPSFGDVALESQSQSQAPASPMRATEPSEDLVASPVAPRRRRRRLHRAASPSSSGEEEASEATRPARRRDVSGSDEENEATSDRDERDESAPGSSKASEVEDDAPPPAVRTAFDVLRAGAERLTSAAEQRSSRAKRKRSDFVEGEAEESDEDADGALGGKSGGRGGGGLRGVFGDSDSSADGSDDEDEDEDEDRDLEGLVDDEREADEAEKDELMLRRYQHDVDADDAAQLDRAQAIADGKLRRRRKGRGAEAGDISALLDDDWDEEDLRRRANNPRAAAPQKRRLKGGDGLDLLAADEKTLPFHKSYVDSHRACEDADRYAFLGGSDDGEDDDREEGRGADGSSDDDDGDDGDDGDSAYGRGQRRSQAATVTVAEFRQEIRERKRRKRLGLPDEEEEGDEESAAAGAGSGQDRGGAPWGGEDGAVRREQGSVVRDRRREQMLRATAAAATSAGQGGGMAFGRMAVTGDDDDDEAMGMDQYSMFEKQGVGADSLGTSQAQLATHAEELDAAARRTAERGRGAAASSTSSVARKGSGAGASVTSFGTKRSSSALSSRASVGLGAASGGGNDVGAANGSTSKARRGMVASGGSASRLAGLKGIMARQALFSQQD